MVKEVVIEEDEDDEFEPLFSYQRVCRPPSDDDSDGDVTIVDGKTLQSCSKRGGGKVFPSSLKPILRSDKRVHEDPTKETEDDDDWLPPPPKSAKVLLESRINEDPTVLEIRQEREELRRLAASSEAALKELENTQAQTSASQTCETVADVAGEHVSAAGKREKVLVTIQNKDGTRKNFRVFKDEKFEKLFFEVC
eukprot:c20490_g1_i1 orf=43-627(+)